MRCLLSLVATCFSLFFYSTSMAQNNSGSSNANLSVSKQVCIGSDCSIEVSWFDGTGNHQDVCVYLDDEVLECGLSLIHI